MEYDYCDNFDLAGAFKEKYEAMSFRSPDLQSIAQAFIRNMNRVRGTAMLPVRLVSLATINECARMEALLNKKIAFHDNRIVRGHPDFDIDLFKQVDAERQRIIQEWVKQPDFNAKAVQIGREGLNLCIDAGQEQARESVQAIMAGMIMGLWTALESLTQDTWISAVNACPAPLASNVMSAADSALKTGNQAKSISYAHFTGSGFDFRRTMGTLLFREKKVDFQQLKTIRAAYKVAFADELDSIFDNSVEALSLLEAIRNLFAHKGGVIDEKFKGKVSKITQFKELNVGDVLILNGKYIVTIANVVAHFSESLVTAVDKWIIENPEPSDADYDS